MIHHILTVFRTELTDHLRDRRSMFATFSYALFGPIIMVVILSFAAQRLSGERIPNLAVIGAEHAPTLVAELERRNVKVERREGDGVGIPKLDGADVVLVIPADYAEKYKAGAPAELVMYRDDRRDSSVSASRDIGRRITAYGADVGQSRLIARGVDPSLATPIALSGVNIAAAGAATLAFATMLLYFWVLAPFFTALSVAIDSTAGERERKSLAPLLAQPVDPTALLVGKFLNAFVFGAAGTAITVILGMNLMKLAPLDALQLTLPLDFATQATMIAIILPLAFAAAAAQVALALQAKTFKEAQTYLTLLSFAPVMAAMAGSMGGQEPSGAALYMPALGQIELMRGLIGDGRVDWVQAAGAGAVCVIVAAACLAWGIRMLKSERMLGQN